MWSGVEAYEQLMGRWSRLLVPTLIDFAGVENGNRVIDVGCGTGSLSQGLLKYGPKIEVVGVDSATPFVEYSEAQLKSQRANLRQADAENLPFPDNSFDQCLSLLVINFIGDAPAAVKEMFRVTRPQGIVAAAVWDYGGGMEMLRTLWDTAIELDSSAETSHERNMPYCREGELSELWVESGLVSVEERALDATVTFDSFDDYWQPFLTGVGPSGAYVSSLPVETRARLREELRKRLAPAGEHLPISMGVRAWAVRGSVSLG
jgi:SAM-dependent methyltransferase